MEDIVGTRLRLRRGLVQSLLKEGRDVVLKLKNNKINAEEACVVSSKLKMMNERFVTEMYNYFKLVPSPTADELPDYTTLQMQADEIVAEIDARLMYIQSMPFTPQTESQIELPKFDGDILKWHEFWDQFSSNVGCSNLDDASKLLYLQSMLIGEARHAIDGFTTANYAIAVDTLKERYGKPHNIIDAHYAALNRIKPADNTAKDCRVVLNEIERHLRVLKSLGEDVNHSYLRFIIMGKFPKDLIYKIRLKLDSKDESVDNICKNLEDIISARETLTRLKREPDNQDKEDSLAQDSQKPKKYESSAKKSKVTCVFCHGEHFNDECTKVKTIQERKQRLKGRCFNCLGANHQSRFCKIKVNCRHCGCFGQHNRALCPLTNEPE